MTSFNILSWFAAFWSRSRKMPSASVKKTGDELHSLVPAAQQPAIASDTTERSDLGQRLASRRESMPLVLDDRGLSEAIGR